MDNAAIVSELRAALRRQGVWGSRAERLIQEWTEHVAEDAVRRMETGAAPDVAREAAWQALGSPRVLAAKAGSELAHATWLGRHPWLGGLVLPMLVWLVLIVAISLVPAWVASRFWDIEVLEKTHPATLHAALTCWQLIFNWVPWLAAMLWLARIAIRMPGGWKLYWVTAIALSIFAPALFLVVQLPQHGPGSGSVYFMILGFLGVIVKVVLDLLGAGVPVGTWTYLLHAMGAHPGPLIQTAILALGAVAFYGRMSGRHRRAVTSAGVIVLFLIVAVVCGVPSLVL